MADDVCKLCGEPFPIITIHLSNSIAVELGYCSFLCLSIDQGNERALAIVKRMRIKYEGQDH